MPSCSARAAQDDRSPEPEGPWSRMAAFLGVEATILVNGIAAFLKAARGPRPCDRVGYQFAMQGKGGMLTDDGRFVKNERRHVPGNERLNTSLLHELRHRPGNISRVRRGRDFFFSKVGLPRLSTEAE